MIVSCSWACFPCFILSWVPFILWKILLFSQAAILLHIYWKSFYRNVFTVVDVGFLSYSQEPSNHKIFSFVYSLYFIIPLTSMSFPIYHLWKYIHQMSTYFVLIFSNLHDPIPNKGSSFHGDNSWKRSIVGCLVIVLPSCSSIFYPKVLS